jgi:hypothetical protein
MNFLTKYNLSLLFAMQAPFSLEKSESQGSIEMAKPAPEECSGIGSV